jgi:hypothetical protein
MTLVPANVKPLAGRVCEDLAWLPQRHRERLGTRKNTRALSPFKQSVLVLRCFFDGTHVAQLAHDNGLRRAPSPGTDIGDVSTWSILFSPDTPAAILRDIAFELAHGQGLRQTAAPPRPSRLASSASASALPATVPTGNAARAR